jgi:cobalt-zinc-cadmium efflux system protein
MLLQNTMGHDHHHHHNHSETGNIGFAFWLNTFFAVLEIVGGLYTNSVAIISDAVHDFGDSFSLGLAYYFHKKSLKKRDQDFSYGYRRFSLLGAFINCVILTVSSLFIIVEASKRFFEPKQPDAKGMIVLAIIGVVINGLAMFRLKKGNSINEAVVSLHFLEDVLGWVAILIGSIIMMFFNIPILDPILSVLISIFILWNVYKNLKVTFRILLQGSVENIDEKSIRQKVLSIPGVKNIHDIHTWSMDGQYNIMTLHVVVDQGTTTPMMEKLKEEVRHCLQHLNLQHITLEMELENKECALRDC